MCESDEWQYQMVKWDEWRAGDSGRKIAFIKFYLLMLRLCITKLFFYPLLLLLRFFSHSYFGFWLIDFHAFDSNFCENICENIRKIIRNLIDSASDEIRQLEGEIEWQRKHVKEICVILPRILSIVDLR